jgi:predicted secreted hydrolase
MRRLPSLLLVAAIVAGCSGGPILANPPAPRPTIGPTATPPARPADPVPIVLPRDDGPHDRLTEWWYYTGHLRGLGPGGTRSLGFEFVMFRAERGSFPTSWASHLAITDETGGRFHYAQRQEIGPAVDRSPRSTGGTPRGFDLLLTGSDPTDATTAGRPPWRMTGSGGRDHLQAALSPSEAARAGLPALTLGLSLESRKPPAMHDHDGWIDFGPAGGSYYYSRTAMDARGVVTLGGLTYTVEGDAWFDHQWGDFISVGGGGWDWYAVNLEDGTEVTLSLVRDADGSYPLVYGTLVDPDGRTRHLDGSAFEVIPSGSWTSPATGARYPAGWLVSIPGERLEIRLQPTVADQELDTRATTGVVYWEGSQTVVAQRDGRPLGGQAYVELTGYAPTEAAP